MKNVISFILLIISTLSFGQRPNGQAQAGEKIKAMKVGMITNELRLTESQAEKFWPVYNAYADEKNKIHQQVRKLSRNNGENQSDAEAIKNQDRILALQQSELDVTKKYRDSFMKVITPQQYSSLLATERKFNQMLLDKLKERQGRN
jgi:Spy/CpxP family protein refolding chaperone